jgi:peptide subunit release factor 1 (eRF1)
MSEGDTATPFRPSLIELESAGGEILASFDERTPARDSVEEDLKRIREYLESELDMSASGAIIVANQGAGVFQTVSLALPVATSLTAGPTPDMRSLVQVAEDNEPYAVLVTEQQTSTLTFFVQNLAIEELEVQATDYPRKQKQGGWSQRRFQARADERVEATAREIAEQTRRALKEAGVDKLVVAGAEVMTSALDAAWHDEVRAMILDTIRVAPDATLHEIAAQAHPIVTAREREYELDAVEQAESAIGMQELGRSGAEAVAVVLARGQVDTLVMNEDFAAPGWIDPVYDLAGAGDPPTEHPAGGDMAGIMTVDLGEEMIRKAVRTGAWVEIVHTSPEGEPMLDGNTGADARSEAAKRLDALGGVAAILRFSVMPQAGETGGSNG